MKTVYNRLHVALETLRHRLDCEHGGDRRAWLLPLVPCAATPRALPWGELLPAASTPAILTGVIAMTAKTKIVAAAAAVLALAVMWAAWPTGGVAGPGATGGEPAAPLVAQDQQGPAHGDPVRDPLREAVAAAPEVSATTGALVVRVLYPDEPVAAAGMTVTVREAGGDFRVGGWRKVTDASGVATFEDLPPGRVSVRTPRLGGGARAEVQAGVMAECTVRIEESFLLTGLVVDATGVPVGGAHIEAGSGASNADAESVTTTAADGTFAIRHCSQYCVVGARAEGYAASPMQYVQADAGAERSVRLVLREPGGAVDGQVVHADGSPVPGAVVRVGEGRTSGIRSTPMGAPAVPAQVRTDADGNFRAIGVPVGTQPLMARAPGMAPWMGTCEAAAGVTAGARIVMSPGVRCEGVVKTDGGESVAGVRVTCGADGDFAEFVTRTARDGTFALDGLPVAEVDVAAWHAEHGKATTRVRGTASATVSCEMVLSNGLVLRGSVADETGAPVGRARIDIRLDNDAWQWRASTESDGSF